MEIFLFGINLALLMFIWNFFWKPYRLNICRDKLFNTRSELRDYFLKNNLGLDSNEYKFVRDYLNVQTHYIQDVSIIKYLFLRKTLEKISTSNIIDDNLKMLPTEHKEVIEKKLFECVISITKYIILRSFFITILMFIYMSYLHIKSNKKENRKVYNEVYQDIQEYSKHYQYSFVS